MSEPAVPSRPPAALLHLPAAALVAALPIVLGALSLPGERLLTAALILVPSLVAAAALGHPGLPAPLLFGAGFVYWVVLLLPLRAWLRGRSRRALAAQGAVLVLHVVATAALVVAFD